MRLTMRVYERRIMDTSVENTCKNKVETRFKRELQRLNTCICGQRELKDTFQTPPEGIATTTENPTPLEKSLGVKQVWKFNDNQLIPNFPPPIP